MTQHTALKAMNAARSFPANTCPASRHTAQIAEALTKGETYPMLSEDPAYCGESIAATVTALWEARTNVADLLRALRLLLAVTQDDGTGAQREVVAQCNDAIAKAEGKE